MDDLPRLAAVAVRSGLFTDDGWGSVEGIVGSCLAGDSPGEVWVTERDGAMAGVAYVAPEPFAEAMWNLYLLAVDAAHHGRGIGSDRVRHIEERARSCAASTLIIETSGLASFAPTRAFYESAGYVREARIRDFYGAGDDKIVYWKSLAAASSSRPAAAHDVVFLGADRDGRISTWNAAAERLIGYPAAAIIGRDIAVLVPEPLRSSHRDGFTAAMADEGHRQATAPFHLPVLCADGRERVFAARFAVLAEPFGTPCGALALLSPAAGGAEPWTPVPS